MNVWKSIVTPNSFIAMVIAVLCLWVTSIACAASKEEFSRRGVDVVHAEGAHPLYFTGASGKPEGLLVDLWLKWSEKTGVPVRFLIAPWDDTLSAVLNGDAIIHAGVASLEDRKKNFAFSHPILTIKITLLARRGEKRAAGELATSEAIGAVKGGYPGILLRERYPMSNVIDYLTAEEVIEAFANGTINGVVMDVPTFHYNNAQLSSPVPYELLATLNEIDLHAAVRIGQTDLLSVVDEGLSAISAEEHKAIRERWFVPAPIADTFLISWHYIGGGLLLVVAVCFTFRLTRGSHSSR